MSNGYLFYTNIEQYLSILKIKAIVMNLKNKYLNFIWVAPNLQLMSQFEFKVWFVAAYTLYPGWIQGIYYPVCQFLHFFIQFFSRGSSSPGFSLGSRDLGVQSNFRDFQTSKEIQGCNQGVQAYTEDLGAAEQIQRIKGLYSRFRRFRDFRAD